MEMPKAPRHEKLADIGAEVGGAGAEAITCCIRMNASQLVEAKLKVAEVYEAALLFIITKFIAVTSKIHGTTEKEVLETFDANFRTFVHDYINR